MTETEQLGLENIVKLARLIKYWKPVDVAPDDPQEALGDDFAYLSGEKPISGYFGKIKVDDKLVAILVSSRNEGFGKTYEVSVGDFQGPPLAKANFTEHNPEEIDMVKDIYAIAEASAKSKSGDVVASRVQSIIKYLNPPEKKAGACRKVLAR